MEIEFSKAKCVQDEEGCWLCLKAKVSFKARKFVGEMKNKPYIATIKEYRKHRSLDANAYFWTLCGKLALKIGISVNEIYREYIKNIGGNFAVIQIRDDLKEAWIKNWESHGIGWVCEDLGESSEGYSNIATYYGSSTYDSRQMSRLIDMVVQDCKEQGIETLTPNELALMKSRWEDAQKNKSA